MDKIQLHSALPKTVGEDVPREIPKMIFESLKPLKAACVENDYNFMAYLIEMTEAEAFRLMRNQNKI